MAHIKIGVIGLGRMGSAIAYRAQQGGFAVCGYDPSAESVAHAHAQAIKTVDTVEALVAFADLLWLMVPAGKPVDAMLDVIIASGKQNVIVVDGGNSKFSDSIRRAAHCAAHGIAFLDCGTSGGLKGKEIGYCLMIGGSHDVFKHVEPLFAVLAIPHGYAYMGASGAGHYVKMVHNGIEYALLQAYAEGFQLLHEGSFPQLHLDKVAQVWCHGSVIRSWILELLADGLTHDSVETISGRVAESGMGAWTVEEAHAHNIPVDLIERSLAIRHESQHTGGTFATQLVSLLRHKFGGHAIERIAPKKDNPSAHGE
ncbi:MAG: NADP-dependent phosphogluconate dehydrogenase [Candidatus Babeliales bacterium]